MYNKQYKFDLIEPGNGIVKCIIFLMSNSIFLDEILLIFRGLVFLVYDLLSIHLCTTHVSSHYLQVACKWMF